MLQLARPEDRDAINALAMQVHWMHVQWRPDIYKMTDELWPQDRFSVAVSNRQLFAAKMDGHVVGYVSVKIRDYDQGGLVKRKVLLIDEICVDEAQRRRGIGTEMMTDIRAIARAYGCTDLQLGVYPQNDAAVAFYQKCGFRIRSIDMQQKL